MTSSEDFLAHYGVKGMRWGKRRTKASAPRAEGYTDRMVKSDRRINGRTMERRVNQKVSEGKDLKRARQEASDEISVRNRKIAAIGGTAAYLAIMYGPSIARTGEILLTEAVMAKKRSNGKKAADRLFADNRSRSHGLSTGPTIRLHQNPTTGNWV